MRLIFEDNQKKTINKRKEITFSSFSSYHLIVVTARAKSKKQLGKEITDDEDLVLKLDNKTFPKPGSNRLIDSPAAFSGGTLHDLAKTVYLFTFLKGERHSFVLEADPPRNTSTVDQVKIYTLDLEEDLSLELKTQAEDGDRRPWLTLVLDAVPLKSVTPTITYSRRKGDSDDVKIKIDGKTRINVLRTVKHVFWRFAGSLLPWLFPQKTETQTFMVNLTQGLHYIEIDADRKPTLENLSIRFGEKLPISSGIPTVDEPAWTGSFFDDTEVILLARAVYGEAGGANHFYVPSNQPKPDWVDERKFTVQIGTTRFYKL